jgi:hypothetical protein
MKSAKNALHVCYTGIGARKSGNHSTKQFMKIAKSFSKDCTHFIARKKCGVCKKHTRTMMKYLNKGGVTNAKNEKTLKQLKKKCNACTKKKSRKCNLQNFIEYSGAVPGKCA